MVTNVGEIVDNVSYQPIAVLVIHQRGGKNTENHSELPMFFVSQHEILNNGIGAGRPVTKQFLNAISTSTLEYLDERIIAHSDNKTIWWKPAGVFHISFSEQTGVKTGKYPIPALLFMLENNKLWNWALKENSRPKPETVVYCSPFYNVNPSGSCCMGNIKLPNNREIEEWERIFIGGMCTNDIRPIFKKGEPHKVWNETIGKKQFPVHLLMEYGTIQNIIDGALV